MNALIQHLTHALGSDPDKVESIPAGLMASFLDTVLAGREPLGSGPEGTLETLMADIDTRFAAKLDQAHWSAVQWAVYSDPRALALSAELRPFLYSLSQRSHSAGQASGFMVPVSGFSQGVSLGSFCHAARVLRSMKVRQRSGPFDWIFFNLPALLHCLNDDFATFMDPRYFMPVPPSERKAAEANLCHHAWYREHFGLNFMFNHHDMSQPENITHYTNAVAGWREMMASPQPSLLLLMTNHTVRAEDREALRLFMQQRAPWHQVLILRPRVVEAAVLRNQGIEIEHEAPGLLQVAFLTASQSKGQMFARDMDNLRLQVWLSRMFFTPAAA